MTLEVAGAQMSEYQEYVYSLKEEYPVISATGCIDKDGIFVPLEMAAQDLHDYKIVQYENVFDSEGSNTGSSQSAAGSAAS